MKNINRVKFAEAASAEFRDSVEWYELKVDGLVSVSLFYQIEDDVLVILRIFHNKRKPIDW